MYLIPCGVILKVGKCVLQLVENLAFNPCLHIASISKCVLLVELKQLQNPAFGSWSGLTAVVSPV